MSLLNAMQRKQCQAISGLGYVNPFLPERLEWERKILGKSYEPGEPVWSVQHATGMETDNLKRISRLAHSLVDNLRERLAQGNKVGQQEGQLYADLVLYHLFDRFRPLLNQTIKAERDGQREVVIDYWQSFQEALRHYGLIDSRKLPIQYDPAHLLACFFQLRRAFYHVFYYLVGGSKSAAELRASVWQSIFTHDLRRYQRTLYRHMDDVTTLITGPSGTGKELVAQAIGHSRYIPFDAGKRRFVEPFVAATHSVNLSALSPTLIESELFGHRRGAFTGAVTDRTGWFESCQPHGTVFLDEIGELLPAIQVKLLRVLQSRTFQRLGDTKDRTFVGKIVAATNRDLSQEIELGRFREDFFYRLCADRIVTPTLRQQLDDCPADMHNLLRFIAGRIAAEESTELALEVSGWIEKNLPENYPWPGNVRELEQCFRNVMIHGRYLPAVPASHEHEATWHPLLSSLREGRLTANQLVQQYCAIVYAQCGSYQQTAERLGLDRRTVRRKLIDIDAPLCG